jgi:hypothetical protein
MMSDEGYSICGVPTTLLDLRRRVTQMTKGSEQGKAVEASLNSRALIHALEAASVPSPALVRSCTI